MTTRAVTEQRIENALFLLAHGEHPSRLPARLGTNLEALVRLFRKRRIPVPQVLETERQIERANNPRRKEAA